LFTRLKQDTIGWSNVAQHSDLSGINGVKTDVEYVQDAQDWNLALPRWSKIIEFRIIF